MENAWIGSEGNEDIKSFAEYTICRAQSKMHKAYTDVRSYRMRVPSNFFELLKLQCGKDGSDIATLIRDKKAKPFNKQEFLKSLHNALNNMKVEDEVKESSDDPPSRRTGTRDTSKEGDDSDDEKSWLDKNFKWLVMLVGGFLCFRFVTGGRNLQQKKSGCGCCCVAIPLILLVVSAGGFMMWRSGKFFGGGTDPAESSEESAAGKYERAARRRRRHDRAQTAPALPTPQGVQPPQQGLPSVVYAIIAVWVFLFIVIVGCGIYFMFKDGEEEEGRLPKRGVKRDIEEGFE